MATEWHCTQDCTSAFGLSAKWGVHRPFHGQHMAGKTITCLIQELIMLFSCSWHTPGWVVQLLMIAAMAVAAVDWIVTARAWRLARQSATMPGVIPSWHCTHSLPSNTPLTLSGDR